DYEDGTAVELRWDFLNDTIWDTDWLATKVITHEFTNFGEVVVKLQVCDKNGLTNEARQQIFVTPKDMVYVPAGQFTMGSDPGEGDADEEPEHVVYLDAYFIDKYEVTNLQYAQFLSAGNGAHYHPLMKIADTGGGKFSPLPGYENHPVVFVTWQDAQAYATWAGKRLPTEAEWEKAARGSSDERTYPWGEGISGARANYNHSGDPYDDGTTPVGYFNGINSGTQDSPSPYGAYDLAGNVWEWLADWYGADYYKTSPTSNPLGPSTGTYKVIRGGSWYSEPARLRCAKRSYLQPGIRLDVVGFRCAK
ncbi:MAG: formylglycine-generating enzyme family protein, partial [candidate division KSB1 bacterium]|nr:formylglycine-generating enzyme family protein [candidate division KSB1 bacterium]